MGHILLPTDGWMMVKGTLLPVGTILTKQA